MEVCCVKRFGAEGGKQGGGGGWEGLWRGGGGGGTRIDEYFDYAQLN